LTIDRFDSVVAEQARAASSFTSSCLATTSLPLPCSRSSTEWTDLTQNSPHTHGLRPALPTTRASNRRIRSNLN